MLRSPEIGSQQGGDTESQWYSSHLRADKLQAHKEPMFQYKSKGRQKLTSQFEGGQSGEFLVSQERVCIFILFRPLADWMRPTMLGWAICLSLLTEMLISSQNILTPRIMFKKLFGHLMAQSS